MNIEKTISKLSGIIWCIGEDLHSFNGSLQDFAAILFFKQYSFSLIFVGHYILV